MLQHWRKNNKHFFPLSFSPLLFKLRKVKTNISTDLCLVLSVCSDLSPLLRGSSVLTSHEYSAPNQLCVCQRLFFQHKWYFTFKILYQIGSCVWPLKSCQVDFGTSGTIFTIYIVFEVLVCFTWQQLRSNSVPMRWMRKTKTNNKKA